MNASVFSCCLLEAVLQLALTVVFKQLRLPNYCLKASVWTVTMTIPRNQCTQTYSYQLHWIDQEVPLKIGMETFLLMLDFVQVYCLSKLVYTGPIQNLAKSIANGNAWHVPANPKRVHLV